MCPLHVANEAEWCQLCQSEYEEAGIPSIRPLVSTLIGALAGGLVAAAFFGAASAGAQRPLRIMIGPTLMLMLLGMLAGVGQRWVRRWWFLRRRPSRASVVPKAVEALLDTAALQNPQIVEIESPAIVDSSLDPSPTAADPNASRIEPLSLMNPEIPAPPALPQLVLPQVALSQVEAPTLLSAPPPSIPPLSSPPRSASRSRPPGERHWMSSGRTPPPPGVAPGSPLDSLPTPPAPVEPFALASLPARSGSAQPFVRTPSAMMERTLLAEPSLPRHTLAGPGPARVSNDAAPKEAALQEAASNDVAASAPESGAPASSAPASSEVSSNEAPASEAPVSDVMATERDALDADVESLEELSAARAGAGGRGSVRPAPALRSTGSERPASYPTRAAERSVARSRASGAPRVGRGPSSVPPPSQRPRSSAPAPSSTRAKAAPRPLQPRPPAASAAPDVPLAPAPTIRLPDSVPAPNSDPAMLPMQSIPPQNDAKEATPRSGWSSVIDEGTAGGW
jgi:hypothetical protein